jgi:hypothetical protein
MVMTFYVLTCVTSEKQKKSAHAAYVMYYGLLGVSRKEPSNPHIAHVMCYILFGVSYNKSTIARIVTKVQSGSSQWSENIHLY